MCDGTPHLGLCPDGTPVTRIPTLDDDSFDPAGYDSLACCDDAAAEAAASTPGPCLQATQDTPVVTVDRHSGESSPSSSLDALETSRGLSSNLPLPSPAELSKKLCSTFRHSGWAERRQRTLDALRASGASAGRTDRFATCGDVAWVLQHLEDRGRFRLATNRCRDRFCVPCANEHRQTVCRNLREALAGKTLRLLTLTLKSGETPLADQLSRLYASWGRLRGLMRASHGLVGGVAFVEVSLNPQSRQWHPHLHIIFEGQWTPKAWLRETWLKITGDSYIVDIRPIRDSDHAAGYVAKYASKAVSANVVNDRERFVEAITAMQAHRLFATFGTWTHLHLSRHPESDAGWEPLRPLYLVILDARSGDVTAGNILRALCGASADDPLTLLGNTS